MLKKLWWLFKDNGIEIPFPQRDIHLRGSDQLERLVELELVENVSPIQLAIRLLIPKGSYLLNLPGFKDLIDDFDPDLLGYPWRHRDPRVEALQVAVQESIENSEANDRSRREAFTRVWELVHRTLHVHAAELPISLGEPIPRHSEPWYCCAEPTNHQLQVV